MKILLTGATGFLGSHVLRALINHGHQVTITIRPTSNSYRITDLKGWYSLIDVDSIDEKFREIQPDAVIHCATVYGRHPGETISVVEGNLLFPIKLLEIAISNNCKFFINTDTFFCKQLPNRLIDGKNLYLSDYTLSKYQFSEWGKLRANEGKITFIDLSMEHLYGPDDGKDKFVPWIESELKKNVPKVELTSGIQERDFVNVVDAAAVYTRLLDDLNMYNGYHRFEVGTGHAMTLRSFVEQKKATLNSQTELDFGAIPMKPEEILHSVADNSSPYLV